jgi:hypothetical protein
MLVSDLARFFSVEGHAQCREWCSVVAVISALRGLEKVCRISASMVSMGRPVSSTIALAKT